MKTMDMNSARESETSRYTDVAPCYHYLASTLTNCVVMSVCTILLSFSLCALVPSILLYGESYVIVSAVIYCSAFSVYNFQRKHRHRNDYCVCNQTERVLSIALSLSFSFSYAQHTNTNARRTIYSQLNIH